MAKGNQKPLSPPKRAQHSTASVRPSTILLFGGQSFEKNSGCNTGRDGIETSGASKTNVCNDTWLYYHDAEGWVLWSTENRTLTDYPTGRHSTAMASLMDKDETVLMFGGYDAHGNSLDDTWTWNNQTGWVKYNIFESGRPGARNGHAMASLAPNQVVMFGGSSQVAAYQDTWVFTVTSQNSFDGVWTKLDIETGKFVLNHKIFYLGLNCSFPYI